MSLKFFFHSFARPSFSGNKRWSQHRKDGTSGNVGRELNKGTMAAMPLVVSLKRHYSVSSWLSLVPPKPLSLHQSPRWVPENKFMYQPFKTMPRFLATFYLTWTNGIPSDFHNQFWCGITFPALVFQSGEYDMDLRPYASQGRTLQLRYPSESQLPHAHVGSALFSYLCSSYQSHSGFFLMSLVIGVLFVVFRGLSRLIVL